MLEDIQDRWTDDSHSRTRWAHYTGFAARLRGTRRDNTRRKRASPLGAYLRVQVDGADFREALVEHGNPFEWPNQLIAAFRRLYEGSGLKPLGSGQWAQHMRATRELYRILLGARWQQTAQPSTLNALKETETALTEFFQRHPDYGPLAPQAHGHVLEQVARVVAKAKEVEQQLSEYRQEAALLTSVESELTIVDTAIRDLRLIERNLEDGFKECRDIDSVSQEVRMLWDQFLRAHVLARREHRPAVKELSRLWLANDQEDMVSKNYTGHARVLGASGSGKTIVLVHRALRLAAQNTSVLVVTLNRSLATVLADTTSALNAGTIQPNIKIISVFDLFQDAMATLSDRTGWRSIETIRLPWKGRLYASKKAEFFGGFGHAPHAILTSQPGRILQSKSLRKGCRASLFEYVRHKAGRTDEEVANYLWDECRYVQGAMARQDRDRYISMNRAGRGIRLNDGYRHVLLKALSLWEQWLAKRKLYEHETLALDLIDAISKPADLERYRSAYSVKHILVDELQDLSTVDLYLIRLLATDVAGENALFFTGDVNQQVYGRHHRPAVSGLNFKGRSRKLAQNYRNTREILEAARRVATAFPPPVVEDGEIVEPELSSVRGPRPLIVETTPGQQERLVRDLIATRPSRRVAVISNNQLFLAHLYRDLKRSGVSPLLLVSNGRMDAHLERLHAGALQVPVTLSDMETVKGYEFDTVVMADCNEGYCPWSNTPQVEYWRPAAAFYAAMTRARDELFMTYHGRPSIFVTVLGDSVEAMHLPEGAAARRVLDLIRCPTTAIRDNPKPGNG